MVIFKYFLFMFFIGSVAYSNELVQVGELWLDERGGQKTPVYWGQKLENDLSVDRSLVLFPNIIMKMRPGAELLVVGQLINKTGNKVLTEGAVQLIKGQLIGQVVKDETTVNHLNVYSKKSVSSIRGTTFVIDSGSKSEVSVIEGRVDVKSIKTGINKEVYGASNEVVPLLDIDLVKESWSKSSTDVLNFQMKEVLKLKQNLSNSSKKIFGDLLKEAKKNSEQFKGAYKHIKKNSQSLPSDD